MVNRLLHRWALQHSATAGVDGQQLNDYLLSPEATEVGTDRGAKAIVVEVERKMQPTEKKPVTLLVVRN